MPQTLIFLLLVTSCILLQSVIPSYSAESSTCLSVYNEGGAPAVLNSPKCPRWELSDHLPPPPQNPRCQFAVRQGRRPYQEDCVICALDIRIPFPGPTGLTEVSVGVVAVFDGHNGSEASDMASKLLLQYLMLHTIFLLDKTFPSFLKQSFGRLSEKELMSFSSQFKLHQFELGRLNHLPLETFGESFHLEILKEALMRTIADIDSRFSKEAFKYNLDSGSTATIVLMVDGRILVANLGDSKALLCSEKYQSPADAKDTALRMYMQKRREGAILRFKDCEICKMVTSEAVSHLLVKELTRDHHPDRDDEKSRVENAGGYVSNRSDVPRVNGQLAVSRAIGDVSFKRFGVSSTPEVTDWQLLNVNDSYLIAASDGVFEGMETQDVCDLLWEVRNDDLSRSQLSYAGSDTLADCILDAAYKRGSTDNMAAAVVLLRSMAEDAHTGLVRLEHAYPFLAKFDRLMIEGKKKYSGCYYLHEKLKETGDKLSHEEDEVVEDDYDTPYALPGHFDSNCGEFVGLNDENDLCYHFGMISDRNGDDIRYPENFSSFFALLESIPLQHPGSSFGSYEHTEPKSRYILRKRFGRGAYGEVWLAFQWNCSYEGNASNKNQKDRTSSRYHINLESWDDISGEFSSNGNCSDGVSDNKLFILKRIMVERGSAVYLSGLREKYFGEIFLNASTSLGGFLSSRVSLFANHSGAYTYGSFQREDVVVQEGGDSDSDSDSTEDTIIHGNKTWTVVQEEGLNHIARYMESFESKSNEIWLVFRHEGISLSKLMYTVEDDYEVSSERAGHAQVLHPSKWWHWLKKTKAGHEEMRSLIWQLLMALKSCHDRNITHRDIKPENMVVCIEDQNTTGCLKGSPNGELERGGRMRIIDFGSAMDEFTMRHLYEFKGPSRAEQTHGYTPPEALLNTSWFQGQSSRNLKYDMWSVGVVFLEMVLGSPDVFQISTMSHALLDKLLEGWNEDLKELAYRLRSFMEMCILVPGVSDNHHRNGGAHDQGKDSPASWKCSEEFFSNLIKSRDPLHLGFPNIWAMRLVRQLLRWDPDDRLTVDEALQHPYFSTSE